MPRAPKRRCSVAGCPNLMPCKKHQWKKNVNSPSAKIRKLPASENFVSVMRSECYARQNGLCAICNKPLLGKFELDHIEPHRGDPALFYDRNNVQDVCEPCHRIKTGQGK